MKIQSAHVYENEIAKQEDFDYGFSSLITNSKIIDSAVNRCEHDYVCGGRLFIGDNGMSVGIRRIWCNSVNPNVVLPLYSENDTIPINIIPPASGTRIDLVEAQGIMTDTDPQQRAFIANDGSRTYSYQTVATKQFLDIKILIKTGTAGSGAAPFTDTGFIKLGEIVVNSSDEVLTENNLRQITAESDGETNNLWTVEQDRTFYLGSLTELVTSFLTEHWRNGQHKDEVIKQWNIDFGNAAVPGKVSGATIPLGRDFTLEQSKEVKDVISAAAKLYEALARFAPLDSPALSGVPTAPTAEPETEDEQLATTEFVQSQQNIDKHYKEIFRMDKPEIPVVKITTTVVGNVTTVNKEVIGWGALYIKS